MKNKLLIVLLVLSVLLLSSCQRKTTVTNNDLEVQNSDDYPSIHSDGYITPDNYQALDDDESSLSQSGNPNAQHHSFTNSNVEKNDDKTENNHSANDSSTDVFMGDNPIVVEIPWDTIGFDEENDEDIVVKIEREPETETDDSIISNGNDTVFGDVEESNDIGDSFENDNTVHYPDDNTDTGASNDKTDNTKPSNSYTTPSNPYTPPIYSYTPPSNNNNPGNSSSTQDHLLKWEEFSALTPEEKDKYFLSFSNPADFLKWQNEAQERYLRENPDVEIGPDGIIDLSKLIDGN